MEQILTWMLTGLAVGGFARMAGRSRSVGSMADLTMGSFGAVFGGWLTQKFGVTAPGALEGNVVAAFLGAVTLVAGLRAAQQLRLGAVPGSAQSPEDLASSIAARAHALGDLERRLAARLRQSPPLPNPNQTFDAQRTFGDRVADRVAMFGGSWVFIGWFLTIMFAWMAANQTAETPFDPYPFILLNLVLSCLAALQAPIIMMSQNRQSEKDRLDAHHDYEVNVRAELQILALHEKLDLARREELAPMLVLLEQHTERLRAIERRLDTGTVE